MEDYYSLGIKFQRGALHLRSVKKVDFRNLFWGHYNQQEFPIELEKLQGSKPLDFIQCGAASFILISEKVKSLLESNSISGWKTYEIILPSSIDFDQKYYGLTITGRSGPIQDEKSVPTKMPPPIPTGRAYTAYLGLHFDNRTKDDVDLFAPEGTTYIFTNNKVKTLFEQNKITNCHFRPTTQLQNFNFSIKV